MTPQDPTHHTPPEFLHEFTAALQADEDDEAVYGWMAEGVRPASRPMRE